MNQTVNMNFNISTNNSSIPQFLNSSVPQIPTPHILLGVYLLLKTF